MDERLFRRGKIERERLISYPLSFLNLSEEEQGLIIENKEYFELANEIAENLSNEKFYVTGLNRDRVLERIGRNIEPITCEKDGKTHKFYPVPRYNALCLASILFSLGYRKNEIRLGMIFYKAQKKPGIREYYVDEHILTGFRKTKDGIWVQSEETGNEMLLIGQSAFFDYSECEKCVKATNLALDMKDNDI